MHTAEKNLEIGAGLCFVVAAVVFLAACESLLPYDATVSIFPLVTHVSRYRV